MNAMYCILKGLSLYNFGNKFVFIVIVIAPVAWFSIDIRVISQGEHSLLTIKECVKYMLYNVWGSAGLNNRLVVIFTLHQ